MRALELALYDSRFYISSEALEPVRNKSAKGSSASLLDGVPLQIRSWSELGSYDTLKSESFEEPHRDDFDQDELDGLIAAINELIAAEDQLSPVMRSFSEEYEAICRLRDEASTLISPWVVLRNLVTGDYKWNTRLVEEAAVVRMWQETSVGSTGRRSLANDPLVGRLRAATRRVEDMWVILSSRDQFDQEKDKDI
ncbi:hypothetical protein BJ508DRAFT_331948 [Ascobolus immersus RN42]|uniref:Uncharacterized protein n=1 Tax=Ascobolus immersus RN42 TaxID=1160509 RepID=A0A3N4HP75_ASCIM|nr:hypothetical protein BJ508DRAFT_331948 [Ascobolus immersus RN42]